MDAVDKQWIEWDKEDSVRLWDRAEALAKKFPKGKHNENGILAAIESWVEEVILPNGGEYREASTLEKQRLVWFRYENVRRRTFSFSVARALASLDDATEVVTQHRFNDREAREFVKIRDQYKEDLSVPEYKKFLATCDAKKIKASKTEDRVKLMEETFRPGPDLIVLDLLNLENALTKLRKARMGRPRCYEDLTSQYDRDVATRVHDLMLAEARAIPSYTQSQEIANAS